MTDSYMLMFLDSPLAKGGPWGFLTVFFLFLARILPIIALSPFFGARVLPHPVKVAFAITLFAVFFPHLLQVTTEPLTFNFHALTLVVKEMFIGLILGFFISLPFIIVQTTGMIIDHQRGGASLMVNDPTIQNQSSPLGTLFNMVLIYIFYLMDGPFLFIDAIVTSYTIIPPDQFLNPDIFRPDSSFWQIHIQLLNRVMIMATQLATPALLAILMTDVFLGITNRLAQQVQITFLGLPLKSLLGLTIIFLGWNLLTKQMVINSRYWLNMIDTLLQIFQGRPLP
ncbi:MAG: flagellar biosynthetic protein FliR [Waddliaceae bacterium]